MQEQKQKQEQEQEQEPIQGSLHCASQKRFASVEMTVFGGLRLRFGRDDKVFGGFGEEGRKQVPPLGLRLGLEWKAENGKGKCKGKCKSKCKSKSKCKKQKQVQKAKTKANTGVSPLRFAKALRFGRDYSFWWVESPFRLR